MPSMSRASRMRPDSAARSRVSVDAGEPRQRRHRVVDLRERAVRADVLHAADDLRREVHRIDAGRAACASGRRSTRRRAPRSCSPDCERHAGRGAVGATSICATSAPVRISTPACARRCSERVGQRAGAAGDEPAVRHRMSCRRRRAAAARRRCRRTTVRGTIRARRRPRCRRAQRLALEPLARRDRRPPSAASAAAGSASVLPSARNCRPACSRTSRRSPLVGLSIDGGVVASDARAARRRSGRSCREARILVGVLLPRTRESPPPRVRRSLPQRSARGRSSVGAQTSASGRTICRPCRSSAERARTINGSIAGDVGERRTTKARRDLARPRAAADAIRFARGRGVFSPALREQRWRRQVRCAHRRLR